MILIMKLISFAFDIDNNEIKNFSYNFNLNQYISYLISINTSLFGPWISYTDHLISTQNSIIDLKQLFKTIVYSLASLSISNCLASLFIYHFISSNSLIEAYTNALTFRLSNYFICYCSQSLCILSNVRFNDKQNKKSENTLRAVITRPLHVELPRSLLDVVTNWNLPMHYWLKTYVFKQLKHYGIVKALLFTYIASAMLHGINFKIASVLLSLGFYTYVEYVLRKKLSYRLNACIGARKCDQYMCLHILKDSNPVTIFINLIFGVLNMFHLAYLGQMFDSGSGDESEINSLSYTIQKWSHLKYSSHLIVICFYLLSKLI